MDKTLSFLDLPRSLRVRIYTLADLIRQCPVNFTREGPRAGLYNRYVRHHVFLEEDCHYYRSTCGHSSPIHELGLECFCSPLPWQLLYVSRTVHDEVERVLYSHNRFRLTTKRDKLSLSNGYDILRLEDEFLAPLHALSPQASKALRSLDIECGPIFDERSAEKWLQICNFLASKVALPYLSLGVSCEVQGELATTIVQELESLAGVGHLKECAISLGTKHIEELAQLAKSTVLRLTDRSAVPAKVFPYAQLPPELRTRILYFTELVPIYNEVQWYSDGIEIQQGKIFRPTGNCCATCTPTLAVCSCWVSYFCILLAVYLPRAFIRLVPCQPSYERRCNVHLFLPQSFYPWRQGIRL